MNITQTFQDFAVQSLKTLEADMPVSEIEAELRRRKITTLEISGAKFHNFFYACCKALISLRWTLCCKNLGIDSKEIQNLLFKIILERYSGPHDLESATAFSEALYAANAEPEQSPLISVATFFMKKVSTKDVTAEAGVPDAFGWIVGVWDGYCAQFENSFDDFVAGIRINESKLNRKRG